MLKKHFFSSNWYYCWRDLERQSDIETRLLINFLELSKGDIIVDVCCGWGRITHRLLDMGYLAYGVDKSNDLINIARSINRKRYNKFKVVDVRKGLPIRCNKAFNIYTSIGFGNIIDDMLILKNIYRSLDVGGLFLLDYVRKNYVKSIKYLGKVELRCGKIVFRRILNNRVFLKCGSHDISWNIYEDSSLLNLVRSAGFRIEKVAGGLHGAPLQNTSKHITILARKCG